MYIFGMEKIGASASGKKKILFLKISKLCYKEVGLFTILLISMKLHYCHIDELTLLLL